MTFYAGDVLRFMLISGLADVEIREDICCVENVTEDETAKIIGSKESGNGGVCSVPVQRLGTC